MISQLDIIVCGIGGQGIVLANEIISTVFMQKGYDLKSTDIIGIGQRGGSVISHIRIGKNILSPLIKAKSADMVIAFEKYEALRCYDYLKTEGLLITDKEAIIPNSVEMGLNEDIEIEMIFEALPCNKTIVDTKALLKLQKLDMKFANSCVVGALSKHIEVEEACWLEAIKRVVPSQSYEKNIMAFREGRKATSLKGEGFDNGFK
ncbi:indolepyruvate oxidoreductase subunit beta [Fusibacter sp. 3D3]|uniref:indolepyruvate oxidoreductase subunit beta n=1 Tax=Fusibacter sp. 3D3 TaxID=1048380 RepID=UPI000853749C|nr:indolepyruvate oxidoreductase subunit beta [Fusibacter sp. 3D3]GAU79292.1 indolepyruvate oxidoreductase subunit IorB [Fusibacter sp. 3D3]